MEIPKLDFVCAHCKYCVPVANPGHGHCPECLWSRHVGFGVPALDKLTSPCGGLMEPLRVSRHQVLSKVAWFRCACGYELSGMPVKRNAGPSSGWSGTMRVFVPSEMRSPMTLKAVLASRARF